MCGIAGPTGGAVLYEEDFESGTARGFTYVTPPTIWHVTENFPASGRYALGWVLDETPGPVPNGRYPFGSGSAITPQIPLDPAARNVLTLDLWGAYEPGWDYLYVEASATGGGPGYIIASTIPALVIPGGLVIGAERTYGTARIDLTALGLFGQMSLRFQSWVSDGDQNDFAGARIDNIRVEALPLSEPTSLALDLLTLAVAGGVVSLCVRRQAASRREGEVSC